MDQEHCGKDKKDIAISARDEGTAVVDEEECVRVTGVVFDDRGLGARRRVSEAEESVTAHTLEQDLGQEYPPGTRRINNQLRHNNRPIRREGDFWLYEDNNRFALLNYNNCSYRNGRYYFTLEDGTEEEDIWNETEAQWELAPQYREPAPVIPEDSEQEETTSESDSDSPKQTPINTRNESFADMSGQALTSTDPPSATVQPGRGKVKLPDNYTGNHIESQKFMLQ
ncbi:hypothetical protein HETIRDRAFT_120782 [Heterobasidion irregulare TC 32-1]|uniref:Uncharacterized protein n=1 Tax=Heterobasidion irregulare (strain TC 32-1) TaxID=747525 RepID=W4KBR5_HETIT|nr:uncharacterized protein HETIRDRAFT_120782 [Heterobasidion irregulare TC 32-1]ETW82516.1 hypothetical protein HETIRDRAFT_120782 [Heterobasidion irregulare TC 32-1]